MLHARTVELQRDQDGRAREAVAAERFWIARELHDVVSHAIAVTVLQALGGPCGRRVGRCRGHVVRTPYVPAEAPPAWR